MRQESFALPRPAGWRADGDHPSVLPESPSITVLPFADLTGDYEDQALADGLTDHLTYTLACIRGLFVSGRNSAFTYKGQRPCIRDVGRVLGVAHVLEGTLLRGEDRVEIEARLSDAVAGRLLWQERVAGAQDALVSLQGAIVARVVATIAPGLPYDPGAIERMRLSADIGIYAKFLAAYSNYVAGSEESVRSLLGSLETIARLVPEHPMPPALLAQGYANLVIQGWSRDVEADAAEGTRHARAALALMADETPAVLTMAGHALSVLGRDHATALRLLERSLGLNPNSAATHERSGWVRCHLGRPEEAVVHFRAARRLSPLDSTAFRFDSGLGLALCMIGEHAESEAPLRRAIGDAPSWTSSYRTLAASLAHLGRLDEARAAAAQVLRLEPGYRIGPRLRQYEDSPGKRLVIEGLRRAGLPD